MWLDDYLSKHLKEGEEPLRVVRRFGLTLVPALAGGTLLLLLDFFLLAWWVQWRGLGLVGFGIVFLIAALWIGRALYIWARNILILTNQRIIDIDQRGIWQRTVAEAPYAKIQDVRYTTRGLWQTIFHYGTVVIQTAGNTTNLELTRVRDPMKLQQLIADIQREVESAPSGVPVHPESLATAMTELRKALESPQVSKLTNRPDAQDQEEEQDG